MSPVVGHFGRRSRWQRTCAALGISVLLMIGMMFATLLLNPHTTPAESRMLVAFQGSLNDGHYALGVGEHAMGPVDIAGGSITAPGVFAASGSRTAIDWSANELGPAGIGQEVLAEIVVSPDVLNGGGVLMDVAGAVRLEALTRTRVQLTAGQVTAQFDLSAAGRRNGVLMRHFGVYSSLNAAGDGSVEVFDEHGELAPPVRVTGATKSASSIAFAQGISGNIYGVGVSTGTDARGQRLTHLPCTAVPLDAVHSISVTPGECESLLVSKASALRPTQRQFDWQQLELTAFVHFGTNTFTGREWGDGDEDPDRFAPSDLNTDQWARALRDSGFRMAILTVKHHDGFVLYPSRYTKHSVASSSWKNGTGDVLRSFVDSARRFGLRVGVYLSPADQNQYTHGVYANGSKPHSRTIPTIVDGDDRAGKELATVTVSATDYGAYFLNQLYEVLTQYGPIDEVWFDGAQGNIPANAVENYDFNAYFALIRLLAPRAVIAVCGPDVRWVGNENGLAREAEWSPVVVRRSGPGPTIPQVLPSQQSATLGTAADLYAATQDPRATNLIWYPAEADVSLRPGWFFHPEESPKSVDDLLKVYYQSAGRNAVLLLNVPPDSTGRLSDVDVERLQQWQAELRQDMPEDYALGAQARVGDIAAPEIVDGDIRTSAVIDADGSAYIDLPGPTRVDRVVLSEDIYAAGQQVVGFAVDAWTGGEWQQVAADSTIGYKKNLAFAVPVTASSLRVRITSARGPVRLASVSLYSRAPSASAPQADYYVDCAAPRTGPGSEQAPMNKLAQLRSINLPASSTVHVRSGTQCRESLELWGYGVEGAPAILAAWGAGPTPTIVGAGNERAILRLARQGWIVQGVSVVDEPS